MNCPACNIQLLMMERLGTQIDYCPQCRGIWLEKGKFDRIIERSGAEMPPKSISEGYDAHSLRRDDGHGHHDKHHDDYYDGHRKKRGLLHDLFD
jgi:uncharacterized protein